MISRFFLKNLLTLGLCLIPPFIVGAHTGSSETALWVFMVLLGTWLVGHLYQIGLLIRWLKRPKVRSVPRGIGTWRPIFATLLRQTKSRKRRKQKLSTALLRFNAAAEAMPNGVIILDADGRIEWFNQLALTHFNLDRSADTKGILKNLIRAPAFHAFLEQPLIAQNQLKLTLPKGPYLERVLQISLTPFDGSYRLLISQDLTDLEQLHATRTDFIANVSHELRTPLTVINGFLETLADLPDLDRPQQQEFIGLMQSEASRMHSLVSDLLTLSRLESKQECQDQETINLSALTEQIAQAAKNLSQGQHLITAKIEPDLWAQGSHGDLYAALSNLAFNAVRYTPATGQIEILLSKKGQDAYFSVSDTGLGIAQEHLTRLTERFYRVDTGRTRKLGGTGLGLAITKHVLALHQTELKVVSIVGKGSTFSTRLKRCATPTSDEP
ncbi:MAG: phosphate regulon sensor histidine kinase PhoR [Neisseriaceae bacterium]|nr:phosphate regulon sensor histidine kinase PhoR [Neisseriaceae bacterium]